MKMYLLRARGVNFCDHCLGWPMVMVRADTEEEARATAARSNSHGKHASYIDWTSTDETTCNEFPLLDGPKGIVVGTWLAQSLPG